MSLFLVSPSPPRPPEAPPPPPPHHHHETPRAGVRARADGRSAGAALRTPWLQGVSFEIVRGKVVRGGGGGGYLTATEGSLLHFPSPVKGSVARSHLSQGGRHPKLLRDCAFSQQWRQGGTKVAHAGPAATHTIEVTPKHTSPLLDSLTCSIICSAAVRAAASGERT